jgi:hypothetical protein
MRVVGSAPQDIIRRAQRRAKARARTAVDCVTCGKPKCGEPNSFAFLMTGAMWMELDGRTGGPHKRMQAFLNVGWHGAHDGGVGSRKDRYSAVTVVDDVPGGQVDLQFCSTRCLRRFFMAIVDAIETAPRKRASGVRR